MKIGISRILAFMKKVVNKIGSRGRLESRIYQELLQTVRCRQKAFEAQIKAGCDEYGIKCWNPGLHMTEYLCYNWNDLDGPCQKVQRAGGRMMEQYKKEFIEFMVEADVLKFGEFTLKSGRKSPFFMNAGAYVTGAQLSRLGQYYAKAIYNKYGTDFDVLFGPAYKGIPLSVATTIAFHELYGKEIRYCSNRKEAKDHGDAGILLGSKIKDGDRVVIIEDVTTSGKSIEETFPIIKAQGDVQIIGLMVSLNRMEKGKAEKCALDEIKELYGMETGAIVTMEEVIRHLYNQPCQGKVIIDDEMKQKIDAYYEEYGAK